MSESIKAFDATTADPLAITGTQIGSKRSLDVFPRNSITEPLFTSLSYKLKSSYAEITSIVSGVTASIITLTTHATKPTRLQSVSASGTNIATYELFINGVMIEKARTYFGGALNVELDFDYGLDVGFNSLIELKVFHLRPSTGDFNATIKYFEEL